MVRGVLKPVYRIRWISALKEALFAGVNYSGAPLLYDYFSVPAFIVFASQGVVVDYHRPWRG